MSVRASTGGSGSQSEWAESWLEDVAQGKLSMSQRKLSRIEERCGIDELKRMATSRGVHLLQLTDDKGVVLVAASMHPFTVLT